MACWCCASYVRKEFAKLLLLFSVASAPFYAWVALLSLYLDKTVSLSLSTVFTPLVVFLSGLTVFFIVAVRFQDDTEDKVAVLTMVPTVGLILGAVCMIAYAPLSLLYFASIPFYAGVSLPFGIGYIGVLISDKNPIEKMGASVVIGFFYGMLLMPLIFIQLKLVGVVSWSWGAALTPLWVIDAFMFLLLCTMFCAMAQNANPSATIGVSMTCLSFLSIFTLEVMVAHGGYSALACAMPLLSIWGLATFLGCLCLLLNCVAAITRRCQACRRDLALLDAEKRERQARSTLGGTHARGEVKATNEEDGGLPGAPGAGALGAPSRDDEAAADRGEAKIDTPLMASEPSIAEQEFHTLLTALDLSDNPQQLLEVISEINTVVRTHPELRAAHYRNELTALVHEKRVANGELWTRDIAREYGKVLRQMSVVRQLIRRMSGIALPAAPAEHAAATPAATTENEVV